ncbi:MAG TPA: radical SAM protein [Candidatus Sulfotelmatobacter sp.]|nr:radical SAM protein [Candidatus Sulfotelmatobacter sp.]
MAATILRPPDVSFSFSEKVASQRNAEGTSQLVNARDFQARPLQVTWEMTKAISWQTRKPRASARSRPDRNELATAEAFHLVDQVAALGVPLLALTGGDPLSRPDLLPIVQYACRRSVRTSLTVFPTPLLTPEKISALKECGLMRMAFWLHGSTPAWHDRISGVPGSYRSTLRAIGWCQEAELPLQLNTTIARWSYHDLDPLMDLMTRFDVVLWSVFFLVPASPEQMAELLSAEEHENVFAKLHHAAERVPFRIKTTEGQHYQRYVLQQRARESRKGLSGDDRAWLEQGMHDSKSFLFINHAGEVFPSRFLPLSAGNVMAQPLSSVYRDAPLFASLRDSSRLKGKCGRCPARTVCGGSRARAYALTGDPLAEEPCCAHQPR